VQTGGQYLLISANYSYYGGYTNYEEIWDTAVLGGSPAFDFYFFNNHWVDLSSGTWDTTWTSFLSGAPSGVAVKVMGNSVLIENPSASEPIYAMKTKTDGIFYVPSIVSYPLKVEMLFNTAGLVGDQTGGTSPYSSINNYPDEYVGIDDIFFVAHHFGYEEGDSGWDYMADVIPDKYIGQDDINLVASHFGNSGTYITSLSGVTVTFNIGGTIIPNSDGFVAIPQGATSFTVKRNGTPIGAMIIFW
jgi:hypothetical protein